MVKRTLLPALVVVLATLAGTPAAPPPARAEPDQHIPDLSAGYCPGGKAGRYHSPTGHGHCDGMHYPDGSYWRMTQRNTPGPQSMQCVINPGGGPVAEPAPPGGCAGAV